MFPWYLDSDTHLNFTKCLIPEFRVKTLNVRNAIYYLDNYLSTETIH